MKTFTLHVRPAAWLLGAALVSCSHPQQAAVAQPAPKPTAAEESQKSFQLAAQDQRELTDQLKRVDAAHAQVGTAQQEVARAQIQEQQARAKVQELQQRANQHLQEAVAYAQQAQTGTGGSGSSEGGLQAVSGTVAQATSSQIVIQTQAGRRMSLHVDPRTRVLIGSEQRSVTDIQQGANAQVAYDPRPGQMTALVIRVMPVEGPGGSSSAGGPGAPQNH